METLGALRSQIHVSLGPTIQQCHYEVGPEFLQEIEGPYENYFYPSLRKGHHYFNLPLYIHSILVEGGISHINDLTIDTLNEPLLSHRRYLSQGKQRSQDNLSVIAMT